MPGKGTEKETQQEFEKRLSSLKSTQRTYIFDRDDYDETTNRGRKQAEKAEAKFWKKNEPAMRAQLQIINRGPAGSDPASMLEWLSEWPIAFQNKEYMDNHGIRYNENMFKLGKKWFELINEDKTRKVMLDGDDPSKIPYEYYRNQYMSFLTDYEKVVGPIQKKETAPAETRPAPQPVQTQQTQPAPQQRQPEPVKAAPAQDTRNYFREDKASLDTLIQKLKDAKTFYNSSAYKNIINVAEMLNKFEKLPATLGGKKVEGLENLDKKQQHAYKMFAIRDMVDKYLNHKAEEGVKQNVYGKLAAVEELHQFVSQKIRDLEPEPFEVGGQRYSGEVTVTFAESEKKREYYGVSDHKENIQQYSEEDWKRYAREATAKHGVAVDPKEGLRVSDCMARIIRKAEAIREENEVALMKTDSDGHVLDSSAESVADNRKINNLLAMRRQFTEKPFSYEKPAQKTMQQTAAKKSNGPQLS